MPKTTTITVRISPEVKANAQKVLERLGLTVSQAVALYFTQISEEQGLPFRPHLINAETRQAMEDVAARRGVKTFDTPEEVFADLGI